MTTPESGPHVKPTQAKEWGAALALLPIAATLGFYGLPASLQEQTLVLFAPQIVAYLAFGLWAARNGPTLGAHNRPTARLPEYVRDSFRLSTSGL
jgi:hypothetical protein